VYVNKQFELLTGYRRAEVLGQNCKFLQVPGVSEESSIAAMREALRQKKAFTVSITNVRKDKSQFVNLLTSKPIFDQNGDMQYVICLCAVVEHNSAAVLINAAEQHYNVELLDKLPSYIQVSDST
jgi:PAS domain S-box-containing protein